MTTKRNFKLSFWQVVGIIIVILGVYNTYLRFTKGLGATTHLSDAVPWGLWIGVDFLGVGLAAAGFTIAATAHIFNVEKLKPIVRPAILTAFLGYGIVVCLLVVDLGKPENFWHPLVMWNIHSVMFEITWCIICYTTVLMLEFAPVILEKFHLKAPIKILKKVQIPVVIAGVLFSTLHQSSFGSLYLIVPGRLYPLWYSSILPVHFFISCIAAGLSMLIFESYINTRVFKVGLNIKLLSTLGKAVLAVISVSFLLKMFDLVYSDKLSLLTIPSSETYLFYLEIIAGTFVPVIILSIQSLRESRLWLYLASIFVISGFVLNRLNVSITGMQQSSGVSYFPSFPEISITMMFIVLAMWAFRLVAENFRVFGEENEEPGFITRDLVENESKTLILN